MLRLAMVNISYCVQDLTNIMSGRGTCTCKSVRMNERPLTLSFVEVFNRKLHDLLSRQFTSFILRLISELYVCTAIFFCTPGSKSTFLSDVDFGTVLKNVCLTEWINVCLLAIIKDGSYLRSWVSTFQSTFEISPNWNTWKAGFACWHWVWCKKHTLDQKLSRITLI